MEHQRHIPRRLAADLRAAYWGAVASDPGRDEAILSVAGERAGLAVGRARRVRLTRWGLAAAAGLAIGISAWIALRPATNAAGDVNGDGRVDILDALVLSRRIGEGRTQRGWDLNHDGRIDATDVDTLAMQAVRLGEKKS
jgi:hypothetical protein